MKKPFDIDWRIPNGLHLVRPTEIASMTKKLIIPGSESDFRPNPRQRTPREVLIQEFLKQWLTEKQIQGMGPWYTDMLDSFMTEVLLKAQKVGIEKMLIVGPGTSGSFDGLLKDFRNRQDSGTRYPLAIVPPKEIKPKKMQVTLEEVGGDLASETKSVLLSNIKTEKIDTSLMDVVDHAK